MKMANTLARRIICRKIWNINEHCSLASYSCVSRVFHPTILLAPNGCKVQMIPPVVSVLSRHFNTSKDFDQDNEPKKKEEIKLTLFQKFKQMYRDYWYVLLPVHLVTSAGWFGSFYYMAKSGIDIVALLETWHVSETIINPLKDSSMGYIALAYAMYKIATPLRYTVTLGGTTISINYLKKWGYIKPVPSTERMKEIYREKKENLIETLHEKKEGIKETKHQLIKSVSKSTEQLKNQKLNIKEKIADAKEKT